MNSALELARAEAEKAFGFKNIAPLLQMIKELPPTGDAKLSFGDAVKIECELDEKTVFECAKALMPWRKGPFLINGVFVDSEWRSFLKYNLIEAHINISGKKVADIGCNNGYYMFRMLAKSPSKLVGFDPSAHCFCQFAFIDHFVKSGIVYELLGIEHLAVYEEKFDTIFCLGVLYHRSDPVAMLKQLYAALEKHGELVLDSIVIDGEEETALCPASSYAKMKNVYFLPTVKTLFGWLNRAGFKESRLIGVMPTTTAEQRKTEWIEGESLESFLSSDKSKTIEGYPAPKRAYIIAKK